MSFRNKFNQEEDELLRSLVMANPHVKWSQIAEVMKTKSARQCRERYNNYLADGINQTPWTKDEDEILLKSFEEYGPSWSKMTSLFNGRTCVSIKNRYAKVRTTIVSDHENKEKVKTKKINNVNQTNKNDLIEPTTVICTNSATNSESVNNKNITCDKLFKINIDNFIRRDEKIQIAHQAKLSLQPRSVFQIRTSELNDIKVEKIREKVSHKMFVLPQIASDSIDAKLSETTENTLKKADNDDNNYDMFPVFDVSKLFDDITSECDDFEIFSIPLE